MREIKIRVWLKSEKRFSYHDLSLDEDVGGLLFILEEEMPHERNLFTGLKDKFKKEIYEGDIIKNKKQIGEIKFGEYREYSSDGGFDEVFTGFYIRVKSLNPYIDGGFDGKTCKEFEIIGNIYENKNLL